MARQIDLDQLMKYPLRRGSEHCDEKNADPRFLNGVESILEWAQTLPTLTPQNELLTLDQLREMDGEPVWVELYRAWALVEVKQNGSIMFYGNSFSCPYSRTWKVYRFRPDRRPPEGEEDT